MDETTRKVTTSDKVLHRKLTSNPIEYQRPLKKSPRKEEGHGKFQPNNRNLPCIIWDASGKQTSAG